MSLFLLDQIYNMMASSNRHKCKHNPNSFCYICGCYTLVRQRRNITNFVKLAYKLYFDIKLGDKKWAPHTVCHICEESLQDWTKGKRKNLPFGVPMVWREPLNHIDDCYFCLVNTTGIGKIKRQKIAYSNIPSNIRPIQHSKEIPFPIFKSFFLSLDEESMSATETEEFLPDLEDFSSNAKQFNLPQCFSQIELNDLVRDYGLSKQAAEVLASHLKEKNLLDSFAKVSYFRTRDENFVNFFSEVNLFAYCHDISGLLLQFGISVYNPTEWRLFIDSSKRSLKCVLLHNGNIFGSVPIGHSVYFQETYDDIKMVLNLIKYRKHNWIICVDLKMVNFLLGQQKGFTKFPCYLCMWIVEQEINTGYKKNGPFARLSQCACKIL